MLIKRHVLEGVAAGRIRLAFRRWKRPAVRAGGRLRTAVGVLAIEAVDPVREADITEDDARRAGFESREDLLGELAGRPGEVYRIQLRHVGPDPREELRRRAELGDEELDAVRRRLEQLDARSPHGSWTVAVLRLIRDRPGTRAAELAASMDREVLPFKAAVRKLKEMGLTESLPRGGYRLSPRGRAVLARLDPGDRLTGRRSGTDHPKHPA